MSDQMFERWNQLANLPNNRVLGESIQEMPNPLSLITESPNTDYVSSKSSGDVAELVQDEDTVSLIELSLEEVFMEISTNTGYSYDAIKEVAFDILNGSFMNQSISMNP